MVSWLQQRLPKCDQWFLRSTRVFINAVPCWGCNDQSLCATDIAQFTAPPSALAYHSVCRWAYHCSANYMTRWEDYRCRSVPVVCQINKCLMTLSLRLFNLIRGGTDLLDGWLYSNRLWIWNRGLPALDSLCVLVSSAAAWLQPEPLNYCWPPEGPAVRLRPFQHPA